jgi:hypothetical protein
MDVNRALLIMLAKQSEIPNEDNKSNIVNLLKPSGNYTNQLLEKEVAQHFVFIGFI